MVIGDMLVTFCSCEQWQDQARNIQTRTDRVAQNEWLGYLLQSQGQDIFRMKGVLNLKDEDKRYVFHGVHMMFDGKLERPWGDVPRNNSLVFIGRKLDRQEIEAGFESCVA